TTASLLGLTADATLQQAYLSARLSPLLEFAQPGPKIALAVGETAEDLDLGERPTDIDDAARLLTAAIQAMFGSPPVAYAAVLDGHLAVIFRSASKVTFREGPGDLTSVYTLGLRGRYTLRVRVNGAESLEDVEVELPCD
ncbi:hypothetical protein KJ567_04840, partial [Candidatus Bipolaricaulota bacterium]|nr:hypothetical protein [Candidatus Bipolaricaulota bacterium]